MISNPDADLWQAEAEMPRRPPRFLTVFQERRTWGELLYALLGMPLGLAGFVFTVVTLALLTSMGIATAGTLLMWIKRGL